MVAATNIERNKRGAQYTRSAEKLPNVSFMLQGEIGGVILPDILLDGGAMVSVMPRSVYSRMPLRTRPPLEDRPAETLECLNGEELDIAGMISANVVISGVDCGPARMVVVENEKGGQVILGLDWFEKSVTYMNVTKKRMA